MRAMTDPRYEWVIWKKSARVGATKCGGAALAYYIDQDPCPMMAMMPTLSLAQRYSKKEIAPMLRDVPAIRGKVAESKSRDSSNTILEKSFKGGSLMIVGAISATDLRSVSIRVLLGDEADGWPASAGNEGDPLELAVQRTGYYHNRKIIVISTPLNEGESRIENLYQSGDQRRYYVPCPHCGTMDVLVWRDPDDPKDVEPGHWLTWTETDPDGAFVVCSGCGKGIEHSHKRWMVERGEWRGERPYEETVGPDGRGRVSFFIWAAYSYSPNATWAKIVQAYLQAREAGPLKLKTFYNTWLGKTWRVRGDAPKWQDLWARREHYEHAPRAVEYVTVGVDVQGDRVEWEAVGWAANQESWSLGDGKIFGDTSTIASPLWDELDLLLARTWRTDDGRNLPIIQLAIDSGFNTQIVYAWVRRHDKRRVMAIKGDGTQTADHPILGTSETDVNVNGVTIPNGITVWRLGVAKLKEELYGWLHLNPPADGEPFPAGWCHFRAQGEEFYQQITAEVRTQMRNLKGDMVTRWVLLEGRANEGLDRRVYARGAAVRVGIDRIPARAPVPREPVKKSEPKPDRLVPSGWLRPRGSLPGRDRAPWLGRR
jgi:phage terminase large subunit GpA-like protein